MQLFADSVEITDEIIDEREIPSDLALVSPLVVRLVDRLDQEGLLDESRAMKVRLCLDEAITNGVKHGNKFDFDKVVRATLFKGEGFWGVMIQDEGDGFRIEDITAAKTDPAEQIWAENGRGLPLMSLYMDDCVYYDDGRTLVMKQQTTN